MFARIHFPHSETLTVIVFFCLNLRRLPAPSDLGSPRHAPSRDMRCVEILKKVGLQIKPLCKMRCREPLALGLGNRQTMGFMPQFIVRIELPGAKGEEYSKLHSAMGHHGFLRTITDNDGIVYSLPMAEYIRYGPDLTAEKVRGDAIAGASAVSGKFAVLVAETNGPIVWSGLGRA